MTYPSPIAITAPAQSSVVPGERGVSQACQGKYALFYPSCRLHCSSAQSSDRANPPVGGRPSHLPRSITSPRHLRQQTNLEGSLWSLEESLFAETRRSELGQLSLASARHFHGAVAWARCGFHLYSYSRKNSPLDTATFKEQAVVQQVAGCIQCGLFVKQRPFSIGTPGRWSLRTRISVGQLEGAHLDLRFSLLKSAQCRPLLANELLSRTTLFVRPLQRTRGPSLAYTIPFDASARAGEIQGWSDALFWEPLTAASAIIAIGRNKEVWKDDWRST